MARRASRGTAKPQRRVYTRKIESQDEAYDLADGTYVLVRMPTGEKRVPLGDGYMWKVGRHEENAVVIASDVVSRQHAIIQRAEDGKFFLIDMGSRNGSFVNGRRVSVPVSIRDGDQISLGDSLLTFHCTEDPPVTTTATGEGVDVTEAFFSCSPTTVMVVDVRGFTVLTQKIDLGLMSQVIGTWFRQGGTILQAHGSWAQKYIGDAIMSVWVHTSGGQQRELRGIIQALVQLVEMTATLQEKFKLADPIRIGAGINTGLATIGNTGSGQLNDYTAVGDTVNAAFRFETATKEVGLDVLVGENTYKSLCQWSSPQPYFSQRTVRLKGYEDAASLWGAKFSDLAAYAREFPLPESSAR